MSSRYTNAILTIIAILLGVIAWQQHQAQPITADDFAKARESSDPDEVMELGRKVPVVRTAN